MQKKALIFAVSAALVMPVAFAQGKKGGGGDKEEGSDENVVELYGKLYPEFVRQKGSGATPAGAVTATFAGPAQGGNAVISRVEMESSNSRFGVRGSEKLGGGLRAIFQLETAFSVDSNNSAFAQRDSFVGLTHPAWGTIKLGRMDTPFKGYADDISFLGISSGNFVSTSDLNRNLGFGTSNSGRFHERAQNVVDYETPQMGGFRAELMWATLETDDAFRHPRYYSGGLKWEGGPFAISVGYEQHKDFFGLSNNVPTTGANLGCFVGNTCAAGTMRNNGVASARSKDEAAEIMLKYTLGNHQFELDANQKKWKEDATANGRASQFKNNSYIAIWSARWSPQWRTDVHYVKATAGSCTRLNAACVTDGLDATQFSIGAAYYFSKRTYLFFMAQWLKNDNSANFASGSQQGNLGEDITQYGMGIHHSF
jgi:predicted porin